jgi:Calx-beta domain/Right handed beta helix region
MPRLQRSPLSSLFLAALFATLPIRAHAQVPACGATDRYFDSTETPVAPVGAGRVFYVDAAGGNDANDGLSEAKAFKTISRAVGGSGAPIGPGDTVRIKTGRYRERPTITKSGTATARIMIGAYGNGPVVIDASPAVTGWTLYSGQIYKAKPGFFPTAVVVDEEPLLPEFSTGALVEGRYYYNSGSGDLYVWAPGGGSPATHDVGVILDDAYADGVHLNQASYVTLYGLTVRFAAGHGVLILGNFVRLEKNRVIFNGNAGISAYEYGGITCTNAEIIKNEIYHNMLRNWPRGRYKWGGWGSGFGGTSPNLLLQGNLVHKNGGEGLLVYASSGGVVFRDNILYDNWSSNIYVDNTPNVVVDSNFSYCHAPNPNDLHNNGDPSPGDNSSLKRLRPEGIMTADENYSLTPPANLSNVTISNNVIVDCRHGITHYGPASGSALKNVKILHNTIVVPDAKVPGETTFSGIQLSSNEGNNTGSIIRNNVVYGGEATTWLLEGQIDAGLADSFKGLSIDHNLWFHRLNTKPFHWGVNWSDDWTPSQWRALAGTAHGAGDVNADPKLVDATNLADVTTKEPGSSSPAFGAAIATGVTKDHDFCTRSATAPTLGAFEVAGSAPPPPPLPSLSINSVTVTEGNSGTTSATFTVTLSAASSQAVSVNWATANGTATAGSDYVAGSGTLNFAAGATSKTLTVMVNGDTTSEPNETFAVNLGGPVNATIADAQGVGTITNDDTAALPTLSINDVTVTEGNSGTTNAVFTVALSAASSQVVTVAWATANGTAIAGSDYVAATGTLTFAANTTSRTIAVAVKGDTTSEANEVFYVNLSNPAKATLADSQGKGTITNDDAAPSLSISNVTLTEANTGTTNAVFTVTLSKASSQAVTVNYATADGTAIAGSDYVAASGTLTFAAGIVSRTIPVAVKGDTAYESNEGFYVNLSAPVNATIADGQGAGTITNNDAAPLPALSIDSVSVAEGASGPKNAVFTVTLSKASTQAVTVHFATANGTAIAGSDYVATAGNLTFPAGTTSKTLNVALTGDTVTEADETFAVNLTTPVNATIAAAKGVGTITNDDTGSGPSLAASTATATPGQTITVTVTGGPGNRLDWVGLYNAAAPDASFIDWKYLSGTRTAPATGLKSATLSFTMPAKAAVYNVRFFANSGYTRLATSGNIVINTALSISDVTVTEGNSLTKTATFTVKLSVPSSSPVSVKYATANGTATAGSDYVAKSGALTFNVGITSLTLPVTVNGDTTVEPNETFTVNLSSPTNALIADAQGVGTITNDDAAGSSPSVSVNDTTATPGQTITVTVAGGPGNTTDWIGLYRTTAADSTYLEWKYLNGTRTAPAAGVASAGMTFTMPTVAGTYNFRFFAKNSYIKLATSATVTVQ